MLINTEVKAGGLGALCPMLTEAPVGDQLFVAPEQNPLIGSAKIALILIKTQDIQRVGLKTAVESNPSSTTLHRVLER